MEDISSMAKSDIFSQNETTIKDQIIKFNEAMKQAETVAKEKGFYSPEWMIHYEELVLRLFEKNDEKNFVLLNEVLGEVRKALIYKVSDLCQKISSSEPESLPNLINIESEISSLISTFKNEVELIIGIEVPNFLINPYIQEIEETVRTSHKFQIKKLFHKMKMKVTGNKSANCIFLVYIKKNCRFLIRVC